MKEAKQVELAGLTLRNVPPDSIKVYISDYDNFSTVVICVGTATISLFVDNSAEASAVCESLTRTTRANYRTTAKTA